MTRRVSIRLDDTTNWGAVDASDEDKAAYEQAVADAIGEAYPGADVTVQCTRNDRPRACVVTRNESGTIVCDDKTALEEEAIEATVLEIARDVWDAGDFWTAQ